MIEDSWKIIYAQYPTKEYGHTHTWERFKVELARILRSQSKDWRDDPNSDVKAELMMLRSARQNLASRVAHTAPSPQHQNRLNRIATRIKETAAKLRPARGWAVMQKVLQEEPMSKNFFSRFRSRHANHNLNELYTCADWANPHPGRTDSPARVVQ